MKRMKNTVKKEKARTVNEYLAEHLKIDTVGNGLLHYRQSINARTGGDNSGKMTTGFPELDKLSVDFRPCDLIIIAAFPGMGSTGLALSIVKNIAIDQNRRTGIICINTAPESIAMRILSAVADVDQLSVSEGYLLDEDWSEIESAMGILTRTSIILTSETGDCEGLISCARRMKKHHDVDCILLDVSQTPESCLMSIIEVMKKAAGEINIPVIVTLRLPMDFKNHEIKRPCLKDLEQYRNIDKIADVIMFIHREDYFQWLDSHGKGAGVEEEYMDNWEPRVKSEIIIAKNRDNRAGTAYLTFHRVFCRFERFIEPGI